MSTSKIDESKLLARFTELARRAGLTISTGPDTYGQFWVATEITDDESWTAFAPIDLQSDMVSAEALIFLWDYLEGRGVGGSFRFKRMVTRGRGGPPYDPRYDLTVWGGGWDRETWFDGKTRIESVIRACISLWTADHEGKNLDSNSTQASAVSESKEEINGH